MIKKDSYVRVDGVLFLAVWGAILGPMFTAICILIWWLERQE